MRANGYARSEGIGAFVLCVSFDNGDDGSAGGDGGTQRGSRGSVATVGSMVRQDGRSASLTAPNGSAQRDLILAALHQAEIVAEDVGCTEAHGTGTPLGDPTEAGALVAAHGVAGRKVALAIGAAKGSVGHSEAASGAIGLLKVQRLLEDALVVGNAHLRVLNPLIGERLGASPSSFLMPSQGISTESESTGVSSFGYSGTIAHALLRRTPVLRTTPLRLPRLVFQRQSFPIYELAPGHPLLNAQDLDTGGG